MLNQIQYLITSTSTSTSNSLRVQEPMTEYQDYLLLILCLFSALCIYICTTKRKGDDRKLNLPPSPLSLPLIGHLHHLLSLAGLYSSLHRVAVQYGHLVYLRLGSSTLVLVSSASVATQICKAQDVYFACRPKFSYADKILYGEFSFINAPYGEYWRFLKKLCVNELLGARQVDRSKSIRSQEILKFLKRVIGCAERSEVIDVRVEMVKLTNNVLCRMAMSTSTEMGMGMDQAEEMRDILKQSFELAGKLYVGEMLGPFKRLILWMYGNKVSNLTKRFDQLLEKILKDHEHASESDGDHVFKDLMDIMLDVQRDEKAKVPITRSNIKAFFTVSFFTVYNQISFNVFLVHLYHF